MGLGSSAAVRDVPPASDSTPISTSSSSESDRASMSSAFQSAALNSSTTPQSSSDWVEAVRAPSAASDLDKHWEGQNTQSSCGDSTRENLSTDSQIRCQRDQPHYIRTPHSRYRCTCRPFTGDVESESVSVTKGGVTVWLIRVVRELSS